MTSLGLDKSPSLMSLTKMPSKLRASQLNMSVMSGTTVKSVLGKKKVTNPTRGFEL